MWSFITSSSKVLYDKTADYLNLYTLCEEQEKPTDDKLIDYSSIIKVDKYTDENGNKRIFPKVGLYEEYSFFFDKPTHIIDNIYLGSAYNAASFDTLRDCNIKTIVNVTKEISHYYPSDFEYIRFDIYDNNEQSIAKYLDQSYQFIVDKQKAQGNILVHCYMGSSRSASVVIYYLTKTQKKTNGEYFTFDDALDFIKKKRNIVNPTFRFTKDLAKSIRFE
jgi:protein-tyrosine phosphatase